MKTTKLTFDVLRQRHGDMEAMRTLEALEMMVYAEERKKILLCTPADRFVEALTRLIQSEAA